MRPDNPKAASTRFLEMINAQEPGMWLAQAKLNGARLVVHSDDACVTFQSKYKRKSKQAISDEVQESAIQTLGDYNGITLDCEHMPGKLYVFDILRHEGVWLREMPFIERWNLLCELGIMCLPVVANPFLLDFYLAQLSDPISEGIVVRRADSRLILGETACAENDLWFKVKFACTNRVLAFKGG